jgi:hypothetical protein
MNSLIELHKPISDANEGWDVSSPSVFDTDPLDYQQVDAPTPTIWKRQHFQTVLSAADKIDEMRRVSADENFNLFEKTVSEARYILNLPDDWDENGALRISEIVWNRAINFARHVTLWSCKYKRLSIGNVAISPIHSGGIDLYWQNDFCDLLINIPATGKLGTYHGENRNGESTSGALDLDETFPELVITWLKKRRS